jgi:phage terminase large subunit-like protein
MFYEMCQSAQKPGAEYQLVFIPWYWQQEYRKPVPEGFAASTDELAYMKTFGLDLTQVVWMRSKVEEFGSVSRFRLEYPATVEEAFDADAVGALWQREEINAHRVSSFPQLVRVVVAIDPQATEGAKDAETGIVVGGVDAYGQGYVLDDLSLDGSPYAWASQAMAAYHKYQADCVVGERNNGGDMVRFTLETVDKRVPVSLVWASRGKQVRAQPIATKYAQGHIHHVGMHTKLEDQMCTWVPGKSTYSPNRIDALVWTFTELYDLQDRDENPLPIVTSRSVRDPNYY